MCTTNRKQQNVMNLLEEYKTSDVVGFSFSHKDYLREGKIMLDHLLDEPEAIILHCMDCLPSQITDIKENGILEFGDRRVILRGDQLLAWLTDENLNVHSTLIDAPNCFCLAIHDHSDVWKATFYVNDEPVELSL